MSNTKLTIRQRLQQMVFPKEQLDPTPMAVPVKRPLTLREEMQRFIRTELSKEMSEQGHPTFEEEDDFEIEDFDDDGDLVTQYTIPDDQIHYLAPESEQDTQPTDLDGSPGSDSAEPEPPPEDKDPAEAE